MLLVRFLPLKLFTAGDIAARGGNFGGRTLAAAVPVPFFGMKFYVVFNIAPLLADPDEFRIPVRAPSVVL